MDLFSKISRKCSDLHDAHDEYSDYNALKDMIDKVNDSHSHKPQRLAIMKAHASSHGSESESGAYQQKNSQNVAVDARSGFSSRHCSRSKKRESINEDHQKAIEEHQQLFQEMNAKENLTYQKPREKSRQGRNHVFFEQGNGKEISNRDKEVSDTRQDIKEDEINRILALKSLNHQNIEQLTELLPHHKVPLNKKLNIIDRIDQEYEANEDSLDAVFNRSMMFYLEQLLDKYCSTISVFAHRNIKIEEKVHPPKEFCLINPIVKLFLKVACAHDSPHSQLLRSDVTSHLTNAITFIACNIDNIQRKLIQAAQGKMLHCTAYNLDEYDTITMTETLFAVNLRGTLYVHGGYNVILFGNIGKEANKNINEEIIKIQPPMNCTKTSFNEHEMHERRSEKNCITIIRTIAPKYLLMYMERGWKDHLKEISAQISDFINQVPEVNYRLQRGDIVGFAQEDAEMVNTFLISVPFLRAQIVSQQRGNVMMWVMDLGTWAFIRREKLCGLRETPFGTLKPLVCAGALKGPVCDIDEDFLHNALTVLKTAVKRNKDIGKTMLLSDAGENLLILAEYPNPYIRLRLLEFILTMVKCEEVCQFLQKQGFDLYLTGRLECLAHANKSFLQFSPARGRAEIILLTKILSVMLPMYKNIEEWRGRKQAQRAFYVLLIGEEKWQDLFESMLRQLDSCNQPRSRSAFRQRNSHCSNSSSERQPREDSRRKYVNSDDECNTDGHSFENKQRRGRSRTREETAFLYGKKINIKNDQITHVMRGTALADIQQIEMAEVICGLLNNNNDGYIYFGISPDSVVTGISLNDEEKSVFLKDVSIIMSRFLRPELPASDYNIKFISVLEDREGRAQTNNSLYVIKVRLHPNKRVVYALHDGSRFYTRKGIATIEHNTAKKQSHGKSKDEKGAEKCKTENSPSIVDGAQRDLQVEEVARQLKEESFKPQDLEGAHNFDVPQPFLNSSDTFSENLPPTYLSPLVRFLKKFMSNN